jgi:hypothetical protein
MTVVAEVTNPIIIWLGRRPGIASGSRRVLGPWHVWKNKYYVDATAISEGDCEPD